MSIYRYIILQGPVGCIFAHSLAHHHFVDVQMSCEVLRLLKSPEVRVPYLIMGVERRKVIEVRCVRPVDNLDDKCSSGHQSSKSASHEMTKIKALTLSFRLELRECGVNTLIDSRTNFQHRNVNGSSPVVAEGTIESRQRLNIPVYRLRILLAPELISNSD